MQIIEQGVCCVIIDDEKWTYVKPASDYYKDKLIKIYESAHGDLEYSLITIDNIEPKLYHGAIVKYFNI